MNPRTNPFMVVYKDAHAFIALDPKPNFECIFLANFKYSDANNFGIAYKNNLLMPSIKIKKSCALKTRMIYEV